MAASVESSREEKKGKGAVINYIKYVLWGVEANWGGGGTKQITHL